MPNSRPPIPDPLQRAVRQKCKFGCVICGCPVYQIDHIEEWADVQKHELDNLTLLCSVHHDQKTKGMISKEFIKIKTDNIQDRNSTGTADLNFLECGVLLGNNLVGTLPSTCFKINDKDFFRLEAAPDNQSVLINAALYDSQGNVVLSIQDNIYQMATSVWDIHSEGNRLIFRNKPRSKFLEIEFNGEGFIQIKGHIYYTQEDFIDITDTGIFYKHIRIMSECYIEDADIGLLITSPSSPDLCPPGGAVNGRHNRSHFQGGNFGIALTTDMLDRYKEHGHRLDKDR